MNLKTSLKGLYWKRDFDIISAGRVQRLIEFDNGKFRTFLQDTERLIVNLTITNKRVENYSCECPASNGAVCRTH